MSIELLKEYIKETKYSQKAVGALLDISGTTVNQYLQGKYPGDVESIDKAVVELVERHRRKELDVPDDFIPTTAARRVLETCRYTHDIADIQLVIGEAGLGKTVALKHYAKTHNNVVMIEVDPTFSVRTLLSELCDTLELTTARNNHAMMKAVIKKLHGSGRLLIVDEAELLTYKPLEILRRIHDKAEIGIVLAGMPRLRANLYGSYGQFKQLHSRAGMVTDLETKLPHEDIAMFCHAALGTNKFDDALYKASGGNARRLNKLLRGVKRMSVKNNKPVNVEMIEQFNDVLIG